MNERLYRVIKVAFFVVLVSTVVSLAQEPTNDLTFAYYRPILDRAPFGVVAVPVKRGSAKPPKAPPVGPPLSRFIKLCALTRNEKGVRVGFLDRSKKPAKNYFLYIGQEKDGYKVVSADFEGDSAVLLKDDITETFVLGSGGSSGAAAVAPKKPTSFRQRARSSSRNSTAGPGRSQAKSYREKLKERREKAAAARKAREAAEVEKVERLTGDALKKHLREVNMNLIRAGGSDGPPLPIELTREEEDTLIAEGVLQPLPAQ